ncbi:MAG: YbaB/EbfC family nucleoid-associated protein [Bacteroidetes bacterium]|nr:YbaB/EbfC family nucleoid-associated protein [Bacteroidota bacterium]
MFGNISQLLEMKKKAEELRSKLESIQVTKTTNGITVDCNANRKILAVHIETDLLNDKTRLEDNMVLAINNALAAAEKAAMGDVAAIAGMPGLGGLFGK